MNTLPAESDQRLELNVYLNLHTERVAYKWWMDFLNLNNTSNFKKPLEIIYLTGGHCQKNEGLKKRPHYNAGIGTFVDCSVNAFPQIHVVLLVFNRAQCTRELFDHFFQLGVVSIYSKEQLCN